MTKESATTATLRKLIKEYGEEGRKELLPELPVCKKCGKPLVSNEDYQLYLNGSWKTKPRMYALIPKMVNDKLYFRKYCEDCIKEKFGKLQKFNTFNEQVIWALEIPEEEAEKDKQKYVTATVESFIERYGKEEGLRKYKEYCDRQAYTNTFEHKKEKYGWTEEDFKKYNQSRAVTLEKLIERHGEEEGLKKWNEYLKKQKNSFDKLKVKNDDEIIRLNAYISDSINKSIGVDKNLHLIYKNITTKHKIFYEHLNFEYFLFFKYEEKMNRVFYDITIPKIKLIIELDNKINHANVKEKDERKNLIALMNEFTVVRVDDKFLVDYKIAVIEALQIIINYYESIPNPNKLSQIIKIHNFTDIKKIKESFNITQKESQDEQ